LRETITTDEAPEAIGPYSQAVRHGDLLFCSGQIPLDPASGELVKQDAAGQARRCLENLDAVCRAAGARLADAVRCTVYLTDLNDYARVNEVYGEFFDEQAPARVAIQAAALPRGAEVEIEAIVAVRV
jgi:2-iminobutanoate/2-iminopropanoate deaminase